MIKKVILSIILIVFLFTLTGCYDANTIENSYYIVALGIDLNDKDPINPYHISIQIAKNKASSSDSGGGSSQSSAYSIYSVDSQTINNGIDILNNYLDKKINLSHCSAIIFSEELAKQGISDALNALSSNHEIRPNAYVLISSSKASDVLDKVSNAGEDFSSRFYEYIINSFDYTGYSVETTFNKLLSEINNTLGDGIAIYTTINKDSIQNSGLAVFKDDRMVGHTSAIESIAYLLLVNKLEESSITIDKSSDENSKLDLEIGIMKKCHKDIEIINNTPYITCDFFITANIKASGNDFDYTKSENILKIEKHAEKYLTDLITDYLYNLSRNYNADILNFENMYTKKCLTNKELQDIHFEDIYKDSVFKVNVNVDIGSTHLFEKE
ncbi:MAG: Ger(x)C family spore germination protein [Clostridia bacterium]|nr:Ger(x)C family spore germination protein [Clostridia bacterium]